MLKRLMHSCGGSICRAKIEADEGDNMKLAGRWAMRSFPIVSMFMEGAMVARFSRAKPKLWVRAFITEFTGIE